MKTQHHCPSYQQHPAPAHHEHPNTDWKWRFRLNVLDLNPLLQDSTTEAQPWICGEPQLMRLLQLVSEEVASLNALLLAAHEPALPCGPADLLHLLGVASIRKPDTWQSRLHFCLRFLIGLARLVNLTCAARLELLSATPPVRCTSGGAHHEQNPAQHAQGHLRLGFGRPRHLVLTPHHAGCRVARLCISAHQCPLKVVGRHLVADRNDSTAGGDLCRLTRVHPWLLAFVAFVCNIAVRKPLAQRGWPCVAPIEPTFAGSLPINGLREAFTAGAAWPALIFGTLLMFSAWYATEDGNPIVWADVGYAALYLAVGIAAIVLDLFPPTFGVKIPSWNEFHAARAEHERRQTEVQLTQTNSAARDADYHLPVSTKQVSMRFADIFGMQPLKDKLLHPACAVLTDRANAQEAPRNGILLHGEPGNGKTGFAEALAGELQVPFIQLTYGDVSSKWVGEMPRVISNVFAYAQRSAPCVLFIDEIDSFITSRDQASGNAEDLKITNTLLTEIVNLRAHRVVLVAATNYLKNLDSAAIREGRFDFKVEVTQPDEHARLGLLEQGLQKHVPGALADTEVLRSMAMRWNGFSVSRIVAVTKAIPSVLGDPPDQTITYDHWMAALREV